MRRVQATDLPPQLDPTLYLVTDPHLGTPAFRKTLLAGQHDVDPAKCNLMVADFPDGPPTEVVEEAYFRYYLKFENDWRSTVDHNKAPGYDTRQGYWVKNGNVDGGYWQHTTGNSGVPGDGRYLPEESYGAIHMSYRGHMNRPIALTI